MIKILAIGDVVSENGCRFLRQTLPSFKKSNKIAFCIANGENSALGNGITPMSADFLFDSGVDFITTGNHVFKRKEIYSYLEENKNIIRPFNFYPGSPGVGYGRVDLGFTQIGVINLAGTASMSPCDNPFRAVDEALKEIEGAKIKIVDFHAEATAEKKAMGFYLDGRVSAVFGTHTHVQTSDAAVLEKGTGYITDLGFTGVSCSVLGVDKNVSISWLKTGMPARFTPAQGECEMNGCVFEIDEKSGRCLKCEAVIIKQ